jgi:hypothetical protein
MLRSLPVRTGISVRKLEETDIYDTLGTAIETSVKDNTYSLIYNQVHRYCC